MTATIAFLVTVLAIIAGAAVIVRFVRVELRKPDPLDYCDPAASEPMPIELKHVSAKNYWEQA